jgi:hypothetical protein
MDRFASITAFVRVTESAGFSAAGRCLNLSKATISDQVQGHCQINVRRAERSPRRKTRSHCGNRDHTAASAFRRHSPEDPEG